ILHIHKMTTKPKKLLLARHASTGPEYQGRFVGASDIPLSESGPEEVARLAGVVASFGPEVTFCSPLLRARQTLELLAGITGGGPIQVDADLREIDFGRWERLSFAEIAAGDSELVKRWSAWAEDFAFPDGEAVGAFLARTGAAAARLAGRPEETILVVAHGGVVRALLCHFLKLPPRHYLLFDVKPARLATIDLFPEGGVLTGLNL
ncbi:MAG TPA: histidine phosphatase family protein, partial [Desulfurivibrionaceae bacterium]|nr:histidine phosphatase family protein [Desulfurivibrionaceae bacterium]